MMASRRRQRQPLLAAAAVTGLVLAVTACGQVANAGNPQTPRTPGAPASGRSGGPAASTQVRSVSSPSEPGPASSSQTSASPVPRGFAATSVTFVSPDEAFVLGTAPCAQAPCTSIARTLDRGATWTGLPAPAEPIGLPGLSSVPSVWGIRFATHQHGFVFGDGLWETTGGGARWTRDPTPRGSVLSLAIVQGQVLAVFAQCPPSSGCGQYGYLVRRPLNGGGWTAVSNGAVTSLLDPDDLIATQAGVAAAVVAGPCVLVTGDGGLTRTLNRLPCSSQTLAPSVAVTSATGLAMLCTDGAYTGHTIKQVYVSGDGWADLGFTTATDGVVIHGPADSDGNTTQRPGQLFLTSDAGATWYPVTF